MDTATLVTTSAGLPVDIRGSNATVTIDGTGTLAVQVDGDALTALQLIDNIVHAGDVAVVAHAVIGAVLDDTATVAVTENQTQSLRMSSRRALLVEGVVSGTAITVQEGAAMDVSAATLDTTISGAALTSLAFLDTIVYNEDVASAGADPGLAVYGIRDDALAANAGVNADLDYVPFRMNNDGALWTQPSAGSLGGCKGFFSNDLDQTEEDIASAACTVYGIYAWNATAAPLWLQIFNTNTVTVGTTAPTFNYIIPANADSDGAGVVIPIPVQGQAFSTALTMAVTTGVGTDSGAPGANDAGVYVLYQD